MSRIQINDLNSSDFGFLSELTDEEVLDINGGGFWGICLGCAIMVAGVVTVVPAVLGAAVTVVGAIVVASEMQ